MEHSGHHKKASKLGWYAAPGTGACHTLLVPESTLGPTYCLRSFNDWNTRCCVEHAPADARHVPHRQKQGLLPRRARTQLPLGEAVEEAEALRVARVADGDVHRPARIHHVVVHRRAALIRVHVACARAYLGDSFVPPMTRCIPLHIFDSWHQLP